MAFNLPQDRLAETLGPVYSLNNEEFTWDLGVNQTNFLTEDSQSAVKLSAEHTGESRPTSDNSTSANITGVKIDSVPIRINEEEVGFKITPKMASLARLEDSYNLIQLQMRSPFRARDVKLDTAVWKGINGNAGILTESLPASNKFTGVDFTADNADATAVFNVIRKGISQVFARSKGRRFCNTIAMPIAAYAALSNMVFAANPAITVLEAVQKAGDAIRPQNAGTANEFRIIPTFQATTTMRFYDRNPEAIQFELSMDLTFDLANPQQVGVNEIYAGIYRFTDVVINDNSGIIEATGVATAT